MEEMKEKKESYKVVAVGGTGEIEEKKSRFIANVFSVETEEEAFAYIEQIKKKYWDARHNCYAFTLGDRMQIMRFSDDGEPQGTAGKPILEVLTGQGVSNACIVITRYFGGVLLGTGGLVRAYTQAAQEGLKNSEIKTMQYCTKMLIGTDYNGIGKIQYTLGQQNVPILNSVYTESVQLEIVLPYEKEAQIQKELTQVTNGKCTIEITDRVYYAL